MMHSGIWTQSIGIISFSSSKLCTYLILLLNLALSKEKHAHIHKGVSATTDTCRQENSQGMHIIRF